MSMAELNFFNSLENLEPKCPKCGTVLNYGVNTRYNDREKAHICVTCGCILR